MLNKNGFVLNLKTSKTDVFRLGVKVPFEKQRVETSPISCPVKLMLDYLHLRQTGGDGTSDPLFINSKGMTLNRAYFIQIIKEIIESLGLLSDGYNGHSFGIGATTTAAKVNVPDDLIKTMGRWSSDCYQRYIRTDPKTVTIAQQKLCHF
ncbi:hypothetical protein SNE40_015880 [Patella caerulea]|uniref:Tyr recombinase domain-containing protein n=1 Tax=Patella caerulea TaxID=87958 RepID=A0AAN8PB29_PATCE